jgi:tetraacyldisaccharide 4'-kinase
VSGRRRGPWAAVMRAGLRGLEVPYTAAVTWRNRRYDRNASLVHRVNVPVISVGNLTLGGTGKTPMVAWIARWLDQRGVRPVIVSRGYGASDRENDEALELRQKLPGVPHLQNPDRVAAAREAIDKFSCGAIVLDDAYQHRRLARDLDIVLLDALEPFGFGHVFPRGTLREPPSALRRADIVVLSRADLLKADARAQVRQEALRLAPQAAWAEVVHAPDGLLSHQGSREPVDTLHGRRVAAFCGIGNPAGFAHTLRTCGCEPAGLREFPDHHRYSPADLDELARWAESLRATHVICTQKDLVKIDRDQLGAVPLSALEISLRFLTGQTELEDRLAI